jgi:hypothetical protein
MVGLQEYYMEYKIKQHITYSEMLFKHSRLIPTPDMRQWVIFIFTESCGRVQIYVPQNSVNTINIRWMYFFVYLYWTMELHV